jgi:rhodanese-related sulfurtransferase
VLSASAAADGIDVDPGELAEWLASSADMVLVDVREPYEHEAGHIDGDVHIELVELSQRAGELERDRRVVFYCRVGSRSTMAAQAFRASGYEAYSMTGGLARWVQEGREISPQDGHVANH